MNRASMALVLSVLGIACSPVVLIACAQLAPYVGQVWPLVPVLWLALCWLAMAHAERSL